MVVDFPSCGVLIYLQYESKQKGLIWICVIVHICVPGGGVSEKFWYVSRSYFETEDGTLSFFKIVLNTVLLHLMS